MIEQNNSLAEALAGILEPIIQKAVKYLLIMESKKRGKKK